MLNSKYHLPHNSIRVDEFKFMLDILNLEKEYYLYDDLRWLYLCEEIKADNFKIFHPEPHKNLLNHADQNVRNAYLNLINNPNEENTKKLLSLQYSSSKTFKGVWNEYVRDYTEFFAFIGLLPTYYKGLKGDSDKRHYISKTLKDFRTNTLTLEDLLLNFKYRNSSKNYDSLDMYSIEVRPFYIAIRILWNFHNKGFHIVDPHILSAIVVHSKNEKDIDLICDKFINPSEDLKNYIHLFNIEATPNKINSFLKEIGRATLLLKPYLKELGVVSMTRCGRLSKYIINSSNINMKKYAKSAVFCNSFVGNLKLTPILGKIINTCFKISEINDIKIVEKSQIFDTHVNEEEQILISEQLNEIGVLSISNGKIIINERAKQLAINPYSDFFSIEDANYVANIGDIIIENDSKIVTNETIAFEQELNDLESIAYGSDGTLYENALFKIINENFNIFSNKIHYGAAATGKRISDIAFVAKIFDNNATKKILIVVECKAGGAVRSFDERKEKDNVENLLRIFPDKNIDGVWYWVANGNSLPSVDVHGGYRSNEFSKNLLQKLNDLQFEVSEFSRLPTIVTAFSYKALRDYLKYIYIKTKNQDIITPFIIPHFWRWSKKFMNLQYVMIHKELNVGV